ncbi:peptide-methionine (S)-S-oxide reductase MsrA [Legionella israelensis]|uniref:Peptide methionine sulfoxide reductase MsrA n=1 Tax=Legionella israelensis TaxID=454 RepID=A0AAX1EDE4_9GAMM|nr:peptide-methionine (S)-S-oxide reductase MsrA [Legionella israelensis]QBR83084.1 peptide-methionine (S)-S-oxide reductase MsrA [Legionella israelensis]
MLRVVGLFFLLVLSTAGYSKQDEAIFAGGCFWCVEADFDKLPGVLSTTSGYDGGTYKNPTYHLVSSGTTNYVESVKIIYDSDKISYRDLVLYFFRHIDPTSKDGQFCDRGRQYRSVIFYLNPEQKKVAEDVLEGVEKLFDKVYTEVLPSTHFYAAEKYHQNYYKKNPLRYKYYRWRCGRDQRVQEVWSHEKS